MRSFANLFLILFIADGGFSLVDELVILLTRLMPFTALRELLASSVILLAIPLYVILGIDRRLPKRVFLPLILFALLCPFSTWLFPALADLKTYGLIVSIMQVLLGMLPLRYFRQGEERCVTMPPELFAGPFFSLRNTLLYSAASLVVVPMMLILVVLTTVDAYMAEGTSGFMRLGPDGLHMSERVYRRNNQTVRLSGMIHVGDRDYYNQLANSIAPGRMLILAEGVSDTGQKLTNKIDYGKVAGILGLTSQQEMRFRGRLIDAKDLDKPLSKSTGDVRQAVPDILRADVDLKDFRSPTLLFLDAFGKHLQESRSFIQGILALNAWGEKNITPAMYEIIMDDILHRRNMTVVRHLDKALVRYDTLLVPWGALHMKEIEAEVLKRGFILQEKRERTSIDFLKMLQGKKVGGNAVTSKRNG
ncbi:hypothetical protein [Pelotalea chapellei]|uniref:Uncharacterized protein n=1 Tax=Pelotalea chapellei TaxID=44671 RepID=A0ABS5U3G1_9BACT|nr:hypothetical protein [Pelotalea chapellei]MBT1070180.1 hypothetical protein [Pelotalea chapellei]